MKDQNFSDVIKDESYSKGFTDGRKLKGQLIAIGERCYLLTASQYKKFQSFDKIEQGEDFINGLEYVEEFGEFIKSIECYNY